MIITSIAVTLASPFLINFTAQAAPAPIAKGSWLMVPQSKDANGDGFIDGDGGVPKSGALELQPSTTFIGAGNFTAQPNERLIGGALSWYLDSAGYPVQLNACASTGATYVWTISQGQSILKTTAARALKKKTCKTTVSLPEGQYVFQLTVRSGAARQVSNLNATVLNYLMVALGDSYASGEGNPRNVEAWLSEAGAFRPYWDDDNCNRSSRGAPAQSALALEKASPYSSVTLVDVACSGATVDSGVLGPQRQAGQTSSQIQQLRGLIGERPIDIATISIGGNDTGFESVLTSCALNNDCPIRRATNGSLSRYPTLQEGVQAELGKLPANFARIAGCLGGISCSVAEAGAVPPLKMAAGAAILPTMYPDITRSASGATCSYLTISTADFAWARDTQLLPTPGPNYIFTTTSGQPVTMSLANGTLNSQVGATSALRWSPVSGSWSSSGDSKTGHGVCAGNDSWVFGLTAFQGFTSASFHPNPAGQRAIAQAITGAINAAVTAPAGNG
jgi:lysophospholipase L1-like esterase